MAPELKSKIDTKLRGVFDITSAITSLSLLLMLIGILSSCTEPNPFNSEIRRNNFSVDYIDLPGPKSIIPGKLCRWRNQDCLIRWNQIFQVDAKNLKVNLLPLPEELKPIVRLDISQDKRLIGVLSRNSEDIFFIEDGAGWKKIPLPVNVDQDEGSAIVLSAKGDKAVFKHIENCYYWDGKKWLDKSYPVNKDRFGAHKILIGDDELYLATNFGLHGGALAKLDLHTSKYEWIIDDAVANIDFNSLGKLWCSSMGTFEGLSSLEKNILVEQCGINYCASTGVGITRTKKSINWPLEAAYFPAMTICEDDSILLGTPPQGIFKYKDHKAIKLASAWNKDYDLVSILQLENGKIAFTADGEGLGVIKENCLPRSVLIKRN
ncbi:MAG: hypothetical protein IPG59_01660 [Candidatus Melainabacteria bacterium]|nr:MAG: hypothetical protein IPG59_01660 [Candidatus Melainabacteria bacterium]